MCCRDGAHLERCHGGNKQSYECAESHVDGITESLKGGKQMSDVDDEAVGFWILCNLNVGWAYFIRWQLATTAGPAQRCVLF